jgi:alpha-1,2-mannosyltransferase
MSSTLEPRRDAARSPAIPWVALTLFLFFEATLVHRYGISKAGLHHVDLPSFYLAATTTFNERASPYGPTTLVERGAAVGRQVFPFLYPPPSLLPLYPLRFLSYDGAKVVALLGNHALILGLTLLLATGLARSGISPELSFFVGAVLLSSDPVVQTLRHSQTNILVLALLVLSWMGLRRQRPLLAGVALAAAILVKPSPILLLLYLAARRAWRALAVAVGTLAVAHAASLVLLPDGVWSEWYATVRPTLAYGQQPAGLFSPACVFNQSLNGLVSRLYLEPSCTETTAVVPWPGRLLTYLLGGIVLGLSLVALGRRRGRGPAADQLGFPLFLLVMFLVGSLSWEHHLVFALPAVVALVVDRDRSTGARNLAAMVAVLGATLSLPVQHPLGWASMVLSIRTAAVALLWVLLLERLWRSPEPS